MTMVMRGLQLAGPAHLVGMLNLEIPSNHRWGWVKSNENAMVHPSLLVRKAG